MGKAQELQTKADELSSKAKHAEIEKRKSAKAVEATKSFQSRLIAWGRNNLKKGFKAFKDVFKSAPAAAGEKKDVAETLDDAQTLDNAEDLGQPAQDSIAQRSH